ncbi:MAG: aminopeptidase P family protein [Bacteroidales bacterium]|nr:aminopeptidase P family protein [Bacteroidales bacterium]
MNPRLDAVRSLMRSRGWDAVVITGGDPHSSEYPAPRWKQVEWVSGFTGEAGEVVITADHAGLWTDTRYFIQAEKQLAGTGIALHKTRVPDQVLIPQWLAGQDFDCDEEGPVIAVDSLAMNLREVRSIAEAFSGKVRIVSAPDFLSPLWVDRPGIPATPIITLGEDITGESRKERIARLRDALSERECDAMLVTALDEIAWLLCTRGSDVEYNPVVISYLLVTMDAVKWFVRKDIFSPLDESTSDTFEELSADGIEVLPYDSVGVALASLAESGDVGRLLCDPSSLNYDIYGTISVPILEAASPIALMKSVKNSVEVAWMRDIHIQDGIAMEKFLYYIEKELSEGRIISERDAAIHLDSLRAEIPGWMGGSFETISAYGANAALPHYSTPVEGSAILQPRGLYLVDSGGQYIGGTTDITRTVPLGECSTLEMEDYTLVLKGHIDLAMAVFPEGTPGCRIDALARNPLWQFRRNFGHGTGHGVGFFLCVHEGPQDIRQNLNPEPLRPGMITSDEPGIYREGLHGVRHENLVLCREDSENEFGRWLSFETLTLCHFDTEAIIPDLLTRDELEWLNAYNAMVAETLSPLLSDAVAQWLQLKCAPLRP